MINLNQIDFLLLKKILIKYLPHNQVWLFGSRVTDHIKEHSDIDLLIVNDQPISPIVLAELEMELAESELSYKVDIVEWLNLDEEFKKIILQRYEILLK